MGNSKLVTLGYNSDRASIIRAINKLASNKLGPGATPTFAGMTITGSLTIGGSLTLSSLTASRLMATDGSKAVSSVASLTSWVAGTTNQVTVTDDGDGTVTLSTPQDIHTGANPTFDGINLTDDDDLMQINNQTFMKYVNLENFFFGVDSGGDIIGTLLHNYCMGNGSGRYLKHTTAQEGYQNIFLGLQCGEGDSVSGLTGYRNVGVGYLTLQSLTTGYYNVCLGFNAGHSLRTGASNVAIGPDALAACVDYNGSVAIGPNALKFALGEHNIGIGANAFVSLINGQENIAYGNQAGFSWTTGSYNILIGSETCHKTTLGEGNIVFGNQAMNGGAGTGTPNNNIVVGSNAAVLLDEGDANVVFGYRAMASATNVTANIAIGQDALRSVSTVSALTAIGVSALYNNTTGTSNTAIGYFALYNNQTHSYCTAFGYEALKNSRGHHNMGLGYRAGYNITSGSFNYCAGVWSGYNITTGVANVSIGYRANFSNQGGHYNTAIGYQSCNNNTAGNNNLCLGHEAGYSILGSGNVCIGYQAGYSETGSSKLYIANSNTATPLIYGDFSTSVLTVNGKLFVDQDSDVFGLEIDSEATSVNEAALKIVTGAGAPMAELLYGDGSAGSCYLGLPSNSSYVGTFAFMRNLTAASTDCAVVYMEQLHASDTQPTLELSNLGSGPALLISNGSLEVATGVTISTGVTIPDGGYVGSVSEPEAIQIEADGDVVLAGAIDIPGDIILGGHVMFDLDNRFIGYIDSSPKVTFNNTDDQVEVTGNLSTTGTVTGPTFNATTDADVIQVDGTTIFHVDGTNNYFLGANAGSSLTDGTWNVVVGYDAGQAITGADFNVILGGNAGYSLTDAQNNVCLGTNAGYTITTGGYNMFVGSQAGMSLASSSQYNVALGFQALKGAGSIANNNVAIGSTSFTAITTASNSVGLGFASGNKVTSGSYNIAIGGSALHEVTTTAENIAIGYVAAYSCIGTGNTVIGGRAGYSMTSADHNIFIGMYAGYRQTTNDNLLIIDNQQRADAATEATNAILYGTMAASPSSQSLKVNADLSVSGRFYPKRVLRQDGEPANGTGSTQIDDEELLIWVDTNDSNRVYLMFNDDTNSNIVKVELT